MSDIWRLRLVDQFSVDSIFTTPESLDIAKKEAVAVLRLKGCEIFRHTEQFDSERDHSWLLTDGWTVEPCDGKDSNGMISGDLCDVFYIPKQPQVQADADTAAP